MKTFTFQGNSDDTFGEYNVTSDDYDNCASGKPIEFLITAEGVPGGVLVTGQYALRDLASWEISIASYDPQGDDIPLPDWPITFQRSDRGYSPLLIIGAPDNAVLRCLTREANE